MSALNEDMCRQVASAGGGAYIHVSNNSNAQRQLDAELDKLSKKEIATTIYSDFDEQFQAFGILALLLLIIEICLLESKNPMLKNISIFGKKKQVATIFLLLMAMTAAAQTDRQYIRQGNKQYRMGDFANAEVSYRKALEKNKRNSQAMYNLGNALMAQNQDSAAIMQFNEAAKAEQNTLRKSKAFHNVGFICQRHQMYGDAIEAYKQSLRLNPKDDETRYNLALCKHLQKKQPPQQQQQQQNKDNEDKNGKDKKDQQQQDKEQQKKEQQQPKMSRDNAEQLLNAAMQNEKATQERLKKAMQKHQRRS